MKDKDVIIRFEKIVDKDGERRYKLISFDNVLAREDLPAEYLDEGAGFYGGYGYCKDRILYTDTDAKRIEERILKGDLYFFETVDEFLKIVDVGCKRLKKINDKVRSIRKKWNGEVEFRF